MKKYLLIIALVIIAIIASLFFKFFWPGLKPGILSPTDNITDILDNKNKELINNGNNNQVDLPLKFSSDFNISIFARDLGKVRVLIKSSNNTLLASQPDAGQIVALLDKDNNGVADEKTIILKDLDRPHGLAVVEQNSRIKLYVAETGRVVEYDYNQDNYEATNARVITSLPAGGGHYTRTLLPLSDGRLLVSVGSSCNACQENDWRRAAIIAVDPKDKSVAIFASGLRNSVFMAPNPLTGEIWATEMGRDFLGDYLPPDEINIIKEGSFYGWPFCYGKNIVDVDFDKQYRASDICDESMAIPSYIDIPAHSAPLGLAFFPKEGWPEEYRGDLLVAWHGSWNRSEPTGYKVVRYNLDTDGNVVGGPEDFINGWLTADNEALGRPVDILITEENIIYISDDKAGVIYRLIYNKK